MFPLKWTFTWSILMVVFISVTDVESISYGKVAYAGQFKYLAVLKLDGLQLCGGAIITERHVLTAAHCVNDFSKEDLTVSVGTTNPYKYGITNFVKKIQVHEHYKPHNAPPSTCRKYLRGICPCLFEPESIFIRPENDIAVLTLALKFPVTAYVEPISYKSTTIDLANICQLCKFAGFGRTTAGSSSMLYWTTFAILSPESCKEKESEHRITEFCSIDPFVKTTVLNGDSGSPLVCGDELVGLASWGCKVGFKPAIFVRVSSFTKFIEDALKPDLLSLLDE